MDDDDNAVNIDAHGAVNKGQVLRAVLKAFDKSALSYGLSVGMLGDFTGALSALYDDTGIPPDEDKPSKREENAKGYSGQTTEELLRDLLALACMENASFGMPMEYVAECDRAGEIDRPPVHVTEFIVERTKLWRETWMVPLIEEIDRRVEAAKDFEKRRREADRAWREEKQSNDAYHRANALTLQLDRQRAQLEEEVAALEQKKKFLEDQLPVPVTLSKRKMEL